MTLENIYKQKKEQDYYSILEITQEATKSEIRSARRKLVSKYHPDRHSESEKEFAMKISSLINNAFEALGDESFRDKYDKSGMTLQYSVSDAPTTIKRVKEVTNLRGKGLTLTAIVDVTKEILLNGGQLEAIPISVPGRNIDKIPRKITISPLTKIDSFLVYKDMGEQKENGRNGDLLVMIRYRGKLSKSEKALLSINPTIPIVEVDNLKQGEQDVELNNLKVKINKKSKQPSLLFIRDSEEINSPLLIKY